MLTPGAPIKLVGCLPVWAGSVSSGTLMGHATGAAILLAVTTRDRTSIPTPSTPNSSPPKGNSALRPLMPHTVGTGLSKNFTHATHHTPKRQDARPPQHHPATPR